MIQMLPNTLGLKEVLHHLVVASQLLNEFLVPCKNRIFASWLELASFLVRFIPISDYSNAQVILDKYKNTPKQSYLDSLNVIPNQKL